MKNVTRNVFFGILAFGAWLGFAYLVPLLASAPPPSWVESWVRWFPVTAALPAFLLSGAAASYFATERWAFSAALAGAFGVVFLWWFTAVSGIWWFVVVLAAGGALLAVAGGYAVQRALRHAR